MIATIAVTAEKEKIQRLQRSYGNHFPAIAATTITEIELFISQRSLSLRSLRSLESAGFPTIAMIAAIAELFFLSDRSDHSGRSDHMETRLKLRIFTK